MPQSEGMDTLEFRIDRERKRLVAEVTGEVDSDTTALIITTARKLAATHGCGLLYDLRNAIPTLSVTSMFNMPRELEVLQSRGTAAIAAAIVYSEGPSEESARFYETVSRNVGLNVRAFPDEAKANTWLDEQGA